VHLGSARIEQVANRRKGTPNEALRVQRLRLQLESTRLESTQIEQVADEPHESGRVAFDRFEETALHAGQRAGIVVHDQLESAFNRGKRRLQFVRHHRQKLRFDSIQLLIARGVAQHGHRAKYVA